MPLRYSVAALSNDTANVGRDVAACLWNPVSPPTVLRVREMRCYVDNPSSGATREMATARVTARGTPGFTVTPTINNNYERLLAPPSGAVLDMALYTVAATVDASNMERMIYRGVTGSGHAWVYPGPIMVPPGSGLAVINATATIIDIAVFTFVWDE